MKRTLLFFTMLALIPMGFAAQPNDTVKAKPGIVAHRGFHRFEGSAENSISAMRHAVAPAALRLARLRRRGHRRGGRRAAGAA